MRLLLSSFKTRRLTSRGRGSPLLHADFPELALCDIRRLTIQYVKPVVSPEKDDDRIYVGVDYAKAHCEQDVPDFALPSCASVSRRNCAALYEQRLPTPVQHAAWMYGTKKRLRQPGLAYPASSRTTPAAARRSQSSKETMWRAAWRATRAPHHARMLPKVAFVRCSATGSCRHLYPRAEIGRCPRGAGCRSSLSSSTALHKIPTRRRNELSVTLLRRKRNRRDAMFRTLRKTCSRTPTWNRCSCRLRASLERLTGSTSKPRECDLGQL